MRRSCRSRPELLDLDLTAPHVWLGRSRPTRSSPATSRRGSGASRCSRSSSPSARSCRGRSRGAGAVATQSYANPRYGPDGLALLRAGPVGRRGRRAADRRGRRARPRQLGVVDADGRGATFTGAGCQDWAGGRIGPGFAAQGNILVSGETVDALAETFEATAAAARGAAARVPRGRRRPRAATSAASSRRRCSSSSATAATRASPTSSSTCGSTTMSAPIDELRRLYGLHDQLFGRTPRDRLAAGRRGAPRRDRRAARRARLRAARRTGPAPRTWRSASTATRGSTPSCCAS